VLSSFILLREEGVSFQRLKTFKTSRDPDYAAKKARVEQYGHIKPVKRRTQFLEFCRYLRSLYPPLHRLAKPSRRRPAPTRRH
jgi:hypothetical protein